MWIADNWTDYEILDTSRGEKLERWGDYLLVRPDPQVIWDTERKLPGWKRMNGHYHRSKKGRRRVGVLRPAGAVDHPVSSLPGQEYLNLQSEALQL